MTSILQCPVCHEPLSPSAAGYQCVRKHAFDAAREGYVNFLLTHRKHSKEPGDSEAMIRSRRRFLDLGLYDGVAAGINATVAAHLPGPAPGQPLNILDAGGGEGFYLKRLKDALAARPEPPCPIAYYGVDISKFAVRIATQRDKAMHWFVASIVDLPFAPRSLDLILNVFSMVNFAEFARILKDPGKLAIVSPGPKHLNGLREIIYPVARDHARSTLIEQAQGLFTHAETTRVQYRLELRSGEEIMDLLAMTPYFWNIDQNTKAKVAALERLATDVEVEILVFAKTGKS
jgi:23S rRNA (guanine745-N1)-methyltransferase